MGLQLQETLNNIEKLKAQVEAKNLLYLLNH